MPNPTNISSILIITTAIVAGCATHPSFDQSSLDKIATSCSLPKGSLIYHRDETVEFKLPQDANFDPGNANVGGDNCLFEELKKAGVKKFCFVGNEQLGMGQQK